MTWDEYRENKWHETFSKLIPVNVECPVCKHYIYEDTSIVLTSYPPMNRYVCLNCDWTGIA